MLDIALLEAGDGVLTLAGTKRVLDDPADPDLAALLRRVMRHIGCEV